MGIEKVDFLVIGAQKSGTTTLYRLLKEHPAVYMPPQKEVAFFANPWDDKYSNGMAWYLTEYFSTSKSGQIAGEASPQYMCSLYAAERIKVHAPHVKLVAVLRNPIDRCYSAYRMAVRSGEEHRPFADVVNSLMSINGAQQISENEYIPRNDRLRPGLYGLILEKYLECFPHEQIHICFMEDLERNPSEVMRGIFDFLQIDPDFAPPSIGKKFHAGGKVRFKSIANLHQLLRSIKPYIPAIIMRRIAGSGYWLKQWNVKAEKDELKPGIMREELVNYYRDDVRRLERNFSISVPWNDFRNTD